MTAKPKMWLTYAWIDDDEGDFSFLVDELDKAGVQAKYDKIALVPGQRLWDQIAREITEGPYDGWGYLLTANSIASEPCREELAYALYRALNARSEEFPLLGLLHGVQIDDVPAPLRVRLCVSLASPNWAEEVKAGLERRAPRPPDEVRSRYVWTLHRSYRGTPNSVAVEVRPRFGELMYWRFAVPAEVAKPAWGYGPSGGRALSAGMTSTVEGGTGEIAGVPIMWFGAGDRLSPGTSAYVVFSGEPPSRVFFGCASENPQATQGSPIGRQPALHAYHKRVDAERENAQLSSQERGPGPLSCAGPTTRAGARAECWRCRRPDKVETPPVPSGSPPSGADSI